MLLDFLMNLFKCEAFVVNFFFYHLNRYIRRGGYGKLVQKEIEAQRQLVDYGAGSLGSFQTAVPSHCKSWKYSPLSHLLFWLIGYYILLKPVVVLYLWLLSFSWKINTLSKGFFFFFGHRKFGSLSSFDRTNQHMSSSIFILF